MANMANYFPKQKRGFYETSSQLSNVIQNLHSYQLATGSISSTKLTQARATYGEDDGRVYAALVNDTVGKQEDHTPKPRGKRKRRRKPKKSSNPTPLQTPPCKRQTSSTALNMLSAYSDSDDSDKYEVPSAIMHMFSEDEPESNSSQADSQSYEPRGQLGYFDEANSSSDETQSETTSQTAVTALNTPLSSYACWKCSNVGHLPQDCTVVATGIQELKVKLSSDLHAYYDQCNKIKHRKGNRCAECGIQSNLASCMECGSVYCDGRGHLALHLLEHPTHTTLYSHKLRRMLKCCKVSCDVVNIYELLMCSVCLGKAFTQHYSMISATWSRSGLKAVANALCCEDHFQWHRMNCPNAAEEHFVSPDSLQLQTGTTGLVSEFFL